MVIVSSRGHFTIVLSQNTMLLWQEIIKFDRIITYIGGGYIDDVSNNDYGKFIVPEKGTYQFNLIIYNDYDQPIGAGLYRNDEWILGAKNGKDGATSQSVILDMKETDEVYLLMARSHCTGTGPGTMDFYIMLFTVHTTPRPGTGQGAGTGTDGFHTHF